MNSLVSYIIPYRKSSLDREYALNFTIKYLNKHFPEIEVIVVEQDAGPQDHNLEGNFRLVFTYNPGLFNRSWGMNCGAEASSRPYVAFADNDVFMSPDDYKVFFEAILNPEIDVVIPSGITVTHPEYKKVKNIKLIEGGHLGFIKELEERERWTFAMMLTLFKKEKLKNSGYWFEEFEGWGAEDNAMDEVITRCLKYEVLNLQLYHIDHARSVLDGNKQPNYELNSKILENIKRHFELDAYEFTKRRLLYNNISGVGDVNKYRRDDVQYKISEIKSLYDEFSLDTSGIKKSKELVLAITTYNRVDYLHLMLISFLKSSDTNFKWKIIIADDGSDDDTILYLRQLSVFWEDFYVIENTRRGVAHQFNTIIKQLTTLQFDVCFKCDDDVLFVKSGWEKLYLNAIKSSKYEHLCYYYTGWRSHVTLQEPKIHQKALVAYCNPLNVQGAFFTITPSIIEAVGYMDALNFAPRGFEHVDYSLRCSRAGHNGKDYIYDALGSNDYIWLNYNEDYKSTVRVDELYSKLSPPDQVSLKLELMSNKERILVPYNENPQVFDDKYMLGLAYEVISDLKHEINKQQSANSKNYHSERKTHLGLNSEFDGNSNELWYDKYEEVKEWYSTQYEVLPLWYKRVGHVIKALQGNRSFKSIINRKKIK